jgi:hypothetical protein
MGWDESTDELANELTIGSNVQLLDNLLIGEPDTPAVDANGNPIIQI